MRTQKVYPEGLLGKKLGMTQIFGPDGQSVAVTAIEVGPCYVLDVKNQERDGYEAVQLGFEPRKPQRITKAMTGHFAKSGKGGFCHVREVRCDPGALGWSSLGHELKVGDVFQDGQFVDVSGVSLGRGFAGVVKRFKVGGTSSTRGTHEYRRHIGSIGQRKHPGRVKKGQRMPGHMGAESVTVQNLEVVAVRPEENVLLVKGGVPGAKGGLLVIRKALRSYKSAKAA